MIALVYIAVAIAIGGLAYWRNSHWHADAGAEFVFWCVGVGVLWPIAIVLDVLRWWKER